MSSPKSPPSGKSKKKVQKNTSDGKRKGGSSAKDPAKKVKTDSETPKSPVEKKDTTTTTPVENSSEKSPKVKPPGPKGGKKKVKSPKGGQKKATNAKKTETNTKAKVKAEPEKVKAEPAEPEKKAEPEKVKAESKVKAKSSKVSEKEKSVKTETTSKFIGPEINTEKMEDVEKTEKETEKEVVEKEGTEKKVEEKEEKVAHRGIPKANFIEDASLLIGTDIPKADRILQELSVLKQKYQVMEASLAQQKKNLLEKIPDLENALESLAHLRAKQEKKKKIKTRFQLADNIFAQAAIEPQNTVFLWIGANVMLEYPFDEAEVVLTTNLKNAKGNLAGVNDDMDFLKDQLTTTDVNLARIHNHRVELRKLAKKK